MNLDRGARHALGDVGAVLHLARELLRLVGERGPVGRVPCKINLIPFNPFPASGLVRSTPTRVQAFAQVLIDGGLVTTVRRTRGDDIDAACGQLAGEVQDRTHADQRMTRAPIVIHPVGANAKSSRGAASQHNEARSSGANTETTR